MEQCKTLGEETYFLFSYCPDNLVLVYGFSKSKQKFKILKDEFILKNDYESFYKKIGLYLFGLVFGLVFGFWFIPYIFSFALLYQ